MNDIGYGSFVAMGDFRNFSVWERVHVERKKQIEQKQHSALAMVTLIEWMSVF